MIKVQTPKGALGLQSVHAPFPAFVPGAELLTELFTHSASYLKSIHVFIGVIVRVRHPN